MPLLVMIYPRGKGIDPASPQTISQCVRVAEELGADMIKTSYPGSPEAFSRITKACSVPVFVAGGEKCSDLESLEMIRDSVAAGGAVYAWGGTPSSATIPGRLSIPSAGSCTTRSTRRRHWSSRK